MGFALMGVFFVGPDSDLKTQTAAPDRQFPDCRKRALTQATAPKNSGLKY